MFYGRTDVPFDKDDSSRYMPWLIAFMVFLAAFAIAGIAALGNVARSWDRGLSDTLTVQLPSAEDDRADERRAAAAVEILQKAAGVERVELLERRRVEKLLEPWLGNAAASDELPLPQVINVEIDGGTDMDVAALEAELRTAVPGASVDDHRVWMDGFIRSLHAAEALGILVFIFVAGATVGTIVFATRTGLGLHRDTIEVLHLIGARDNYIAGQFAARSMILGLRGAAIGIVAAVPILLGIGFLIGSLDAGLLPELRLSATGWVGIVLLLPATAGIAWLTARITVLRTLTKKL